MWICIQKYAWIHLHHIKQSSKIFSFVITSWVLDERIRLINLLLLCKVIQRVFPDIQKTVLEIFIDINPCWHFLIENKFQMMMHFQMDICLLLKYSSKSLNLKTILVTELLNFASRQVLFRWRRKEGYISFEINPE